MPLNKHQYKTIITYTLLVSHAKLRDMYQSNHLTPRKADHDTEQSSNEVLDDLGLSPISLLDFPSDLDLNLDLSSLQPDIGHSFDAHDLQGGMSLATLSSQYPSQFSAQEESQVHRDQAEDGRRDESSCASPNNPQGSHMLRSSDSTSLSPYAAGSSNHSTSQSSIIRNMTPKSLDFQYQDRSNAHTNAFDDRDEVTGPTIDKRKIGAKSCQQQMVSGQPHSTLQNTQSSNGEEQRISKPCVDPLLASWICNLSNLRVELHLHMLSVPPVEAKWTDYSGKKSDSTQHSQEIAIDSTIQLSDQYTAVLQNILSNFKSHEADIASATAIGTLDQPSQLLLLSTYLCLAESYDKTVQHIKMWTEARFNMGGSSSVEQFPIQFPSLAIGSFKLSTFSSSQPLILTCVIEAMILQIRNLISQMTEPIHSRDRITKLPDATTGDQSTRSGEGHSGLVRASLQAIRAKEDSLMTLIHRVCRLALKCRGP